MSRHPEATLVMEAACLELIDLQVEQSTLVLHTRTKNEYLHDVVGTVPQGKPNNYITENHVEGSLGRGCRVFSTLASCISEFL